MVLTNLAPDFYRIKKPLYNGASRSEPSGLKLLRTKLKKKITKLCCTKRNRINGYLERRQVKYTHREPRKLAMFGATSNEFAGTCQDICRNFSPAPQKCAEKPPLLFTFLMTLTPGLCCPGIVCYN